VIGTRTGALALTVALAFAGCGGGSDEKAAAPAKAAESASATTAAPASSATAATPAKKPAEPKKATTKKHVATTAPKPTPSETRAQRIKRAEQLATRELLKLCPKTRSKLPHLPQSADGMPSYARAVLPTARRNAGDLRNAHTRVARTRVSGLASTYQSLMPLLSAVGDRGTSDDEVRALSKATARYVRALRGAAVAAGVPRCALPV
jgi:hypothetical protein